MSNENKKSNFDRFVTDLLNIEGGYVNHPKDRGGETNFGISKRAYPNLDIKNLTREKAIELYKKDYWDKLNLDDIESPAVQQLLFDQAVNRGVTAVKKQIKELGASDINEMSSQDFVKDFLDSSKNKYNKIIKNNPSQETFKKGWSRRLFELEKNVLGNPDDSDMELGIPQDSLLIPEVDFAEQLMSGLIPQGQSSENSPQPVELPPSPVESNPELDELAELEALFSQPSVPTQPSQPEAATPGVLQTAGRMFTQGSTLGFGDELGGAIQSGLESLSGALGGPTPYADDQALLDQGFTGDLQPSAFDAGLSAERQQIGQMRDERPLLSLASEGLGGAAADAITGLGPVASGALYGIGEGESALGRAAGGVLGGTIGAVAQRFAPDAIGAAGGLLRSGSNAMKSAAPATVKQIGDEFSHAIAPGIKNIYTAISGNITQKSVPVLEAMTRQADLFFGQPVKQNSKSAQATVNKEITNLNKELSNMTKRISAESGENMLVEFQGFADRIRRNADLTNSESLRKMADEFDDSILSGDYEDVVNTYKRLIKNRRQYSDDGKISRYKGANPDIVEELDMLFSDTNMKFLDDATQLFDDGAAVMMDGSASDQLKSGLSKLRDLHIVDRHLDEANRFVRKTGIDAVTLQDSLMGGVLGGGVGMLVGAPQVGAALGAVGAASARRSVVLNNVIGNLKNNISSGMPLAVNKTRGVLTRSLDGALQAAELYGPELVEAGVDAAVIAQLNKAATGRMVDVVEANEASLILMGTVPELFEEGVYPSEIDGKISDPNDISKEQARINQVLKGKNIDRAKALSALNDTGAIYQAPEASKGRSLIKPVKTQSSESVEVNVERDTMNSELKELAELEAMFGGQQ